MMRALRYSPREATQSFAAPAAICCPMSRSHSQAPGHAQFRRDAQIPLLDDRERRGCVQPLLAERVAQVQQIGDLLVLVRALARRGHDDEPPARVRPDDGRDLPHLVGVGHRRPAELGDDGRGGAADVDWMCVCHRLVCEMAAFHAAQSMNGLRLTS